MLGALIGAIIVGAILGVAGRLILPGEQDIGWPQTIGLGVVASLVAGLLTGWWAPIWLSWLIAAVVSAMLLSTALKKGWLRNRSNA